MGRKLKYKTYEELIESKRIRTNKYNKLHRDEINKKSRERYNRLKQIASEKND